MEEKKKKQCCFKKLFGRNKKRRIAVVRLEGVIKSSTRLSNGISLCGVKDLLDRAFASKACAVALVINSPGGSPVQSALIADYVRRLSAKHDTPVYTFCEDVGASGGYWLLCAGDHVYAQPASIVGSIGVIFSGFGFVDTLKKLGVTRRVHTSGKQKSQLDPFLPEKEESVAHLKVLQSDIHAQFIEYVKKRRGDALKGDEDDLFSGNFWVGTKALELGLVDGLGDMYQVLEDQFGEKIKYEEIKEEKGWFKSLVGLTHSSSLPQAAADVLHKENLWQKMGL